MSEPSMIEKMARALHARKYGEWYEGPLKMTDSQRACLADARAAIESIPDDDEAFLAALSRRAHDARFGRPGETYPVLRNFIRALKDAALQECKEGE